MLKWAIIFAIISLVAGVLGFTGVASGAAGIAKILFYIFIVVAVIFVVLALLGIGAVAEQPSHSPPGLPCAGFFTTGKRCYSPRTLSASACWNGARTRYSWAGRWAPPLRMAPGTASSSCISSILRRKLTLFSGSPRMLS